MKILYVEDDTKQRELLQQVLEMKGYTVRVAEKAQDGVEQARTWYPDVILMDLRMPVIDGFEAARNLQSDPDPNVREIPIIAISAWGTARHRRKAADAGAIKFFQKPVDFDILIAAIEEVTE
jgi:CheY-like chemotaxis protein